MKCPGDAHEELDAVLVTPGATPPGVPERNPHHLQLVDHVAKLVRLRLDGDVARLAKALEQLEEGRPCLPSQETLGIQSDGS